MKAHLGKAIIFGSLIVLLSLTAGWVGAAINHAETSSFPDVMSYQGYLTDGLGQPIDAAVNLQFAIYDVSMGGSQLWAETHNPVQVNNGYFTVMLGSQGSPLNGSHFGASQSYIETRIYSGGSYVALTPRQQVGLVPYALRAYNADSAPWTGITSKPSTLDQLAGLACAAGQVPRWNGSAWACGGGGANTHVIVVAKSGGDYTTITAALNSIGATSEQNSYLVLVAPGIYTETVTMKQYVDIEGAGEQLTKITQVGSSNPSVATLYGASNAELRFLTVENVGGNLFSKTMANSYKSPRLKHVTLRAHGATGTSSSDVALYNYNSYAELDTVTIDVDGVAVTNYGIYNDHSQITARHINIDTDGATTNYGIANYASQSWLEDIKIRINSGTTVYGIYNAPLEELEVGPTLRNVDIRISGGTTVCGICHLSTYLDLEDAFIEIMTNGTATGLYFYGPLGPIRVVDIEVYIQGGDQSKGVYNQGLTAGLEYPISHSKITVSCPYTCYGIYNQDSGLEFEFGTVYAGCSNVPSCTGVYAIYNTGATGWRTLFIDHTKLNGGTNSIKNSSQFWVAVGESQLEENTDNSGGGTMVCIGVYDSTAFYQDTCP